MSKAEKEKQGKWHVLSSHAAPARPSPRRSIWQWLWRKPSRTAELEVYIQKRRASKLYVSPSTEKRRPS